jgi:hypothetical protein
MKKVVSKKIKNIKEKEIANSDVLNVVLDLKDLMLNKFEDTRRELMAFTELKFSEVVGILKDERQINQERYEESKTKLTVHDKEFAKLNFKVDHIIDKIDTHETRITNVEKAVFEEA